MSNKTHKITVKFNQQQLQLLENLKKESKLGDKFEDIILNIVREYTRRVPEISPASVPEEAATWIAGVQVKGKNQAKNQ